MLDQASWSCPAAVEVEEPIQLSTHQGVDTTGVGHAVQIDLVNREFGIESHL